MSSNPWVPPEARTWLYLQRLPAQVVKIDQAFVRELTRTQGADLVLVETMISLGHRLGYRVVAEGVETTEAAEILTDAGCEEAQGYLFGRPMEIAQFDQWLADNLHCRQIDAYAA